MMRSTALALTLVCAVAQAPPAPQAPAQPGRPQRLAISNSIPEGLTASDWSSIRQQYAAHRHTVVPAHGGYEARNPEQQLATRFDGRGFITQPNAGGWQWGLELHSYGFLGHERSVAGQPRVTTAGPRVTYDWNENLQEWFVNETRGLEHGFTLRSRPSGANGKLHLNLAVRGGLRPEVMADRMGVRFLEEGTSVVTYSDLIVRDADGRALRARFEPMAPGETVVRLAIEEQGARYPVTVDPVVQRAYVKASNTGFDDGFASVAVSGNTVVVGAYGEQSSFAGVQNTSVSTPQQADDTLYTVGAAYVFVRSSVGTWSQQAYLKASNPNKDDRFGVRVAISGDTVVVGATWEQSSFAGVQNTSVSTPQQANNSLYTAGAAYVFVRNGTTWSQQAYLKASNTGGADYFGASVAVSGDTVVVGAWGERSSFAGVQNTSVSTPQQADNSVNNAGAAYVYVRNGTTWSQQAYLKASNTGPEDAFGVAVSVSGDTVVVGAYGEKSNFKGVQNTSGSTPQQADNSASFSGAAYVFVRNGTTWSQQAYLKASNTGGADYFGASVAVSGDTVVVGANGEDSNFAGVQNTAATTPQQANDTASYAGAAYVFVRNGTLWNQQAYLKPSNTGAGDFFGGSVAVSGDVVIIGAEQERSSFAGVQNTSVSTPQQADNSLLKAGAAYVFLRSGSVTAGTWSQTAYLKASNTGGEDGFGRSVAVSGGTAVVGAYGEASNFAGVQNTSVSTVQQADNSLSYSGAAYVFNGLKPIFIPGGDVVAQGPFHAIFQLTVSGGDPGVGGVYGVYNIHRSADGAGSWSTIASLPMPEEGLAVFQDTNAPLARALYRVSSVAVPQLAFNCSLNKSIECDSPWTFDEPTSNTDCVTNLVITVLSTVTNSGPCPLITTRTWLIADTCGNSNSCSQTVTVNCCTNSATNCCGACTTPYPVTNSVVVNPGVNYLNNPLCHGVNTLGELLPVVPDSTLLQLWVPSAQAYIQYTYFDGIGWLDNDNNDASSVTLKPGKGFLLQNPSGPFTIRWTGCIPDCPLPCLPTATGLSLVGPVGVGAASWPDISSCPLVCGTEINIWNGSGFDTHDYLNDSWVPPLPPLTAGHSVFVRYLANTNCGPCTNNHVINGSFETPVVANDTFTNVTSLTGWTTTDSQGEFELWTGTFGDMLAASGNQHLEINANDTDETVSQVVTNLSTNCPATFCFQYTGRFGPADAPDNDFTVTLSGGTSLSAALNPAPYANEGWVGFCTSFVPTSSSITIAFRGIPHSTINGPGGAHIDKVSLIQCCP